MSRDLFDLAASAKRTANALPEAQRRATQSAAVFTTRIIRGELLKVTGDMRLSGVRKGGAPVGAKFKPVKGTGVTATAFIKGTGAIALIEHDTPPHVIYPRGRRFGYSRKGNISRKGRGTALKFGGRFAAYADHPGTRGKHPFAHGVQKAAPLTPYVYQKELQATIRRAW